MMRTNVRIKGKEATIALRYCLSDASESSSRVSIAFRCDLPRATTTTQDVHRRSCGKHHYPLEHEFEGKLHRPRTADLIERIEGSCTEIVPVETLGQGLGR